MADLMHQDVGNETAKRLLALGPFLQDGAPVEKHHVRLAWQIHHTLLIEIDAVIEAKQVEWALDPERIEHLVRGEVLDANQDIVFDPWTQRMRCDAATVAQLKAMLAEPRLELFLRPRTTSDDLTFTLQEAIVVAKKPAGPR